MQQSEVEAIKYHINRWNIDKLRRHETKDKDRKRLFYTFPLPYMFSVCIVLTRCKPTRDCSGCSAGPDWRPGSDTSPPRTSWASADRSANTRWGRMSYKLTGLPLDLLLCSCCSWLTMKYWMISGLLLDFSSTSVNTSSTSVAVRKKRVSYSLWYRIHTWGIAAAVCLLPSTAPPLDIFFKYIVMSAALRDTEAEMLTRGREPADTSSGGEQKQLLNRIEVYKKRQSGGS